VVVEGNMEVTLSIKIQNIYVVGIGNKILTWDNGQQRNWISLGWCYLCKKDNQ
jgi:hypothetical protein